MPPVNTVVVQTVLCHRIAGMKRLSASQSASSGACESALEGRDYLIGDFSGADIMLGHACFMSNRIGCL